LQKSFVEETVLFVSIIKWAVLSILTGIVVGLSCTLFLKILGWSTAWSGSYGCYFLLLPLALFLSSLMIKYLAPDAGDHGTEKVIEAIHKRWGKIKLVLENGETVNEFRPKSLNFRVTLQSESVS
jgi:H+/Cl- antiporter ClcA